MNMNEKTQLFNLPRIDVFIPEKSEDSLEKQDFSKPRNYVIQGMLGIIIFVISLIMASATEKIV